MREGRLRNASAVIGHFNLTSVCGHFGINTYRTAVHQRFSAVFNQIDEQGTKKVGIQHTITVFADALQRHIFFYKYRF